MKERTIIIGQGEISTKRHPHPQRLSKCRGERREIGEEEIVGREVEVERGMDLRSRESKTRYLLEVLTIN